MKLLDAHDRAGGFLNSSAGPVTSALGALPKTGAVTDVAGAPQADSQPVPPSDGPLVDQTGSQIGLCHLVQKIGLGEIGAVFVDLDWIVMKAIEKSRMRRYESAGSFARGVRRILMAMR